MASRIELTDPRDLALARIAQGARVASTTLPSGLVTPEDEHLIVGAALVRHDPREDHPTRQGIFRSHNCWRCQSGAKPCVRGATNRCEYPRARND